MTQFEQEVLDAARKSIVKEFADGNWFRVNYQDRMPVPRDLAERVYALIDFDLVLSILRPKVNEMVADRIAASIAQELTTDIKKVLSHEPTRLRLRAAVVRELDKVVEL